MTGLGLNVLSSNTTLPFPLPLSTGLLLWVIWCSFFSFSSLSVYLVQEEKSCYDLQENGWQPENIDFGFDLQICSLHVNGLLWNDYSDYKFSSLLLILSFFHGHPDVCMINEFWFVSFNPWTNIPIFVFHIAWICVILFADSKNLDETQ